MTIANLNKIDDLIEQYCQEDWKFLLHERSGEEHYKAKAIIFKEGETLQNISIVKSGNVKIFSTYAGNSQRIYRFATEGQIIGHRGLGGDYTFPVSAVALTDTVVTNIPLPLFQSLLKANPHFCYYFMLFFAEELRRSEQQMKDLSTRNLRQRVASALLMNIKSFGFDTKDTTRLNLTISRKDIAYLAGTTYESVIRTLSDFEKESLIVLTGKEIGVPDVKKLKAVKTAGQSKEI